MIMIRKIAIVTLLAVALTAAKAQTTLDTALNFSVKDTHGNTIELFEILDEGKIAVIDFYRTDCSYCNIYAPDFQEAYEAFGCNTGNVYFYSIDEGHDNETVEAFKAEHGLEMAGASGLEGNGNAAFDLYNIISTPTMIVIKPDREIANQHVWPPEADSLIAATEEAGGIQMPCSTATSNLQKPDIKVYPNPATHTISTEGIPPDAAILIRDQTGRVVLRSGKKKNIDVSQLQSGTYFVSFRQEGIIHRGVSFIIN